MKISASLIALLVSSSEAFAPATFGVRRGTQLAVARPDTSSLIQEALAASKKYGANSKEARLAWEAVEEVDSADNSEATKGSLNEECAVDQEWISQQCLEYNSKLEQLNEMISTHESAISKIKALAEEVQQIKLAQPEPAQPKANEGEVSAKLRSAVAYAKKVTDEKGITSSEARVAWDIVEEIAAAGRDNALGGKLSEDECFVDAAMEACQALEELNRALKKVA